MKTLTFRQVEELRITSGDPIRKIYKIVDCPEFVDKLIANYGIFPAREYDAQWHDDSFPTGKYASEFRLWLANGLAEQTWPISHVLNGDLSQKRILDLGCGSRGGTEDSLYRDTQKMYEPWLCRALLELGASPMGIDIGRLHGEMFEHYTLNLLSQDSLSFLGNNSVDVAHVAGLFTSPTGYKMDGFENLKGFLIPQLERIVKPDGYFIETI